MDAAEELFERLKSLGTDKGVAMSPERALLKLCRNELASVERLHFDFKEKEDTRIGSSGDSDKRNLAKAVSGFANSEGGVLIWGIADRAKKARPIKSAPEFFDELLRLAPLVVDPPAAKIDGDWLRSDSGLDDEGFVFLYVPESFLPPHRVILQSVDIKDRYYVRSGSDFVVATHAQLEDMFGRRPRPDLRLYTKLVRAHSSSDYQAMHMVIGIENAGRGLAKFPYLSVEVNAPYSVDEFGLTGNRGSYGLSRLDTAERCVSFAGGADRVVHPGVPLQIARIQTKVFLDKGRSAVHDLQIDCTLAAEGVATTTGTSVVRGKDIFDAAYGA